MSIFSTANSMSLRSSISLAAGVLVIIFLMAIATIFLVKQNHAVLFSDVAQSDAASILTELEKMKVKYRLEDGGSRILVPDEIVHETRLKLMGSGTLLSGGVGFEVFDNSDFGMTEFAQKINFQRALQGELTRTIMSLSAVKFARVHLVMPERGLFQQDDNPPSASVTLFLRSGQRLEKQQITGMQRLVASAVPDLSVQQVTVSNQDGITLSPLVDEENIQIVSGRLQQKRAVEQYLSKKVNDVLSMAFGKNKTMVSVDVVLNFNQVKMTKENILSDDAGTGSSVVRRRESKFGGAKKADSANTTTEIEYRHGRTVAEIVESPGKIERLNIGVLVPERNDPEFYQRIRRLVAVTVGLNESRGDAIAIYPVASASESVETITPVSPVEPMQGAKSEVISSNNQSFRGEIPDFSNPDVLAAYVQDRPMVFGGISIGLLLFALLIVRFMFRQGGNVTPEETTLSEEQRKQILLDLQTWLLVDEELPEKSIEKEGLHA